MTTYSLRSFFSSNKPATKARFNLLRNFSLVSLGGFVLTTVLLSNFYRQQAINDLIISTEDSNVTLTRVFANTLWARYGSFLADTKALSDDALTSDSQTSQLHEEIVAKIEGSPVAKVKVFDLKGRTVFSTDTAQIGADKSKSSGFLSAKSGQVVSQLGHRDTFKAVRHTLVDRHLLSSYIPIYKGGATGEIVGVFELYTDVTPLLERIEQTQRSIVIRSLLILSALYVILFLFVRRADSLIKKQYQQVQESEARYRQQSLELEDRVSDRTQELSKALSELQQTQTQLVHQEKISSLGQMVAGIAHEINNPVNFIHGNLEHLESYIHDLLDFLQLYEATYPNATAEIQEQAEELEVDFVKEDLASILSSMQIGTTRIREIVLSLRNFSRKDEAEYKAVNIHEGLESTLLILGHRLKGQPDRPAIRLVKEFGKLPLVECYAGQLNQVFMNILSNAIDAIDTEFQSRENLEKTPTITLRTEERANSVIISIADNGTGIPDAVKNRIFEPFFTTKEVGKGTGIGMAISYQLIVEKHRGKFGCFSTEGEGTEFIIEIPTRLAPDKIAECSSN